MQINPVERSGVLNIAEHNDRTIEKIGSLAKEGRPLAIFLCRGASQPLPLDGRTWVSLDIEAVDKVPEGRLHLIMDVNHLYEMTKLQGLFEKAVLDWSSLICCERPYEDFKHLLRPHPQSELIIEALPGSFGSNFTDEVSIDINNGKYTVPIERGGRSGSDIWNEHLRPMLEEHLATLYNEVSFHKDKWPFEDGDGTGEGWRFTLRGPR